MPALNSIQNQDMLRVDVFHEDFAKTARGIQRILVGVLAIVLWTMFSGNLDTPETQETINLIGFLLVLFGVASEIGLRRARRNKAILAVGPSGICFPANRLGPIDWTDVTGVRLVRISTRGVRITAIRFCFRPGVVTRRQFGNINRNCWELILSIDSLFNRNGGRIRGGVDSLINSVERFHPIEGR